MHTTPTASRARLGVLGFICTLSLVTYLDRICIMRARKNIETDLDLTTQQMGFVFAAFSLGYALFEVPGGWMGDRWGSRRVLTRIVLCWSVFTALTGCVRLFSYDTGLVVYVPLVFDSFVLLLMVRFLFGAGEAGAYPNLTRVVADWFPFSERGFAQGGVWFSARIGGAIAPFVFGRLTAAIGWRATFFVLGVLGVVWAAVFWVWFRDKPEEHPACNDAERDYIRGDRPKADPNAGGHGWPGVAALAGSLTVWAMCFASFWVCFGWYFYPTWQPKYLEDVFNLPGDAQQSELLTGLPFLCGAIGSLLGGGLSDWLVRRTGSRRWGRSLVGLVGFFGAGVCVFATGFVAEVWQAVALLCLAFLINDLAIPVIWASCADVGGPFAGSVAGLMNMVGAVAAMLSPALIPFVLAWLPASASPLERWRYIFLGMAAAWFLAAAAWLAIDASRPLAAKK